MIGPIRISPARVVVGSLLTTWSLAVGAVARLGGWRPAAIVGALGSASTLATVLWVRRAERDCFLVPIARLGEELSAMAAGRELHWAPTEAPALDAVERPLLDLTRQLNDLHRKAEPRTDVNFGFGDSVEMDIPRALANAQTRSGMFEPATGLGPRGLRGAVDVDESVYREVPAGEMVNRLDPKSLAWLESSPAEQNFLGWPIAQLRRKSFLEIVHADDRELAREQLRSALIRGEAHGLVYRIKTAKNESKAIEVNVGVRFDPDRGISHIRCHLADVTAKVRAGRELRRRTRDLTTVNEQLRKANRELEELKDRYRDLYQNAPALYYSVDERAIIVDCNDTLLKTLGYRRDQVIGRSAILLMEESLRPRFSGILAKLLRDGRFEFESRWVKSNGELLAVWLTTVASFHPDGSFSQARVVAQDVTPRRTLEAALREKNDRLGAANAELQRKIKELDEFNYVVSHDLQEPIRTLIAFSDFLIRDYGDRLDDEGREYVRYLVEASRRMRSLIQDLLSLSRAGRVTADFRPVKLDEVVDIVRSDLAELIRSRGGQVRVVAPLPIILGDRDRLVQLFANLIGNGLKYNQNLTPTVEVAAVPPAGKPGSPAVVKVTDNGIGIDPKFHQKVFELFRRLHTREEYEGTGAGLAISQKIAQAHGGRIWLESEPGRGCTFFVGLPRAELPPDGDRPDS